MKRAHRWTAIAAGTVATAALLTGCQVFSTGALGLKVEDSRVVAVVTMCEGSTSHGIKLLPSGGRFPLDPHPTWEYDPTEDTEVDLGSVSEFIDLLEGTSKELTNLADGALAGIVDVSEDTIDALEPGDILTTDPSFKSDEEQFVVTAEEFDRMMGDFCADYHGDARTGN